MQSLLTVALWLLTGPLLAQLDGEIDQAAPLDRRLTAVRAAGPIVVDGTLDEPTWRDAAVATGFIQSEPKEGEPATEDTEVRILYDDTHLYFGVFAHDRHPSRIIVNDLKKDFATDTTDTFELVLDTFRDERSGYLFAVNPAGAKRDAQTVNEGREINANWDAVWSVGTQIREDGWYAEIAIPFRTLKFANQSPQTWGLNFRRRLPRNHEDSSWSPLPRIYDLSRVSLAGTLDGLQGLHAGKNLRVKPYALASVGQTAGASADRDGDLGLDVKYAVTSSLTADFTLNTDFSQVEADEQQVNLTRFNLLFPEKRDFFLENSGVFQFGPFSSSAGGSTGGGGAGGGGRPNAVQNDLILFFSRRIGLSDTGDAIPILAGTRLSGRIGNYTLGAINIQQRSRQDDRAGELPATNFTAFRVRRDILTNSDIGVMLLNKDATGSHYNRVAGVDANLRFFTKLDLSALAAKTFSPEESVGGSGKNVTARAGANYRDRIWDLRASYLTIGQRFNDEIGYVPRRGINKTGAYVGPHLRPRFLSRWVRETFPHWEFSNVTRHAGGLDSRSYDYHVPFTFHNSGFIEVGLNRSIEQLVQPFDLNPRRRIAIPTGHYDFNEWFVTGRTNSSAPLSFSGRYALGSFYDGYKHGYQAGAAARLSEQLNLSATFARNVIRLPVGAYSTNLLTGRVNYGFSTSVFLNAFLQYNTDARLWSSNVRFNIIHRPLSDFFLVFNEQRDSRSADLMNRAVIAKMTYMVAF